MRTAAWFAVVVLGVGLAHTAGAQPRGGGGGAAPAERRQGPGAAERREQIKQKIRAIRDSKLTEALVLDEPTAGRLFPVLARYDDETDKLLETRIDVQRRLRRVYALRDTRAVEQLLDEAVANQRGFWDLEDKRIAELRKVLTPVLTAKLLVVLPELERKIQHQLRKAIVKRHRADKVDKAGAEVETDLDDDQEPDEVSPQPAPQPPQLRREAPRAPRGTPSNAPGNTPPCDPNTQPCR